MACVGSLWQEQEDHARAADGVSLLLVEELERKAVAVEARLWCSEEENAALKRRMESYHIRWLQYEIRIKSLEEAFHEQMAALQVRRSESWMSSTKILCTLFLLLASQSETLNDNPSSSSSRVRVHGRSWLRTRHGGPRKQRRTTAANPRDTTSSTRRRSRR